MKTIQFNGTALDLGTFRLSAAKPTRKWVIGWEGTLDRLVLDLEIDLPPGRLGDKILPVARLSSFHQREGIEPDVWNPVNAGGGPHGVWLFARLIESTQRWFLRAGFNVGGEDSPKMKDNADLVGSHRALSTAEKVRCIFESNQSRFFRGKMGGTPFQLGHPFDFGDPFLPLVRTAEDLFYFDLGGGPGDPHSQVTSAGKLGARFQFLTAGEEILPWGWWADAAPAEFDPPIDEEPGEPPVETPVDPPIDPPSAGSYKIERILGATSPAGVYRYEDEFMVGVFAKQADGSYLNLDGFLK